MKKKVLLVIASHGFQPVEYGGTKQVLEGKGIAVITASDIAGEAVGSDGNTVHVDCVLAGIGVQDYDGVFFIGGPGALNHLDTQESHRILNEAMLHQVPYGAICISPRILARANVLIDKQATGWDDDGQLASLFANNNVVYVREPVVTDGMVVTASGPEAAEAFGEAIANITLSR